MLIAEASRPDANINIMRSLIQKGAALNNDNGGVLKLAATARSSSNVDIVTMLIQAGASVNAADLDGTTALMAAATSGFYSPSIEVVTKLIQAGANVNATKTNGLSILGLIVTGRLYNDADIAVLRVLMNAGADSSVHCSYSLSVLEYAKNYGAPAIIIQLLSGETGNPVQKN
jgi:ankyrin repeat protein